MPDMEMEIESQVSQYCFCVKFFFQENQIIKHSKECFGVIFAQIGVKIKLLQNLGSQFFDVKIMLLHAKNQKKLSNHIEEKHLAD